MAGIIDKIMASMKDDEGLFQGGKGGRILGRARDATAGLAYDDKKSGWHHGDIDPRTHQLSSFQKGEAPEFKSSLIADVLKEKEIYAGGGKRKITWEDLGIEGDPRQDPNRWSEIFGEKWNDPLIRESLKSAYESGDIGVGRNFADDWNVYGLPHAEPVAGSSRSALFQHGQKTGEITGDILAGRDTFNVQDLVKRSGMVPDPDKLGERGLAMTMKSREFDEDYGIKRDPMPAEPYGWHKESSQREAERALEKGGFILDSRIEDVGY